MDKLIATLAPVFAAGFAVQQLLEILTSFLDLDARSTFQKYKKAILGAVALVAGIVLAFEAHLRVLKPLLDAAVQNPGEISVYVDYLATGLVISAGTEGINSILKFLKYKKEDVKNEAAAKVPSNASAPAATTAARPTESALTEMNRK
ncbi:MAG: hypothetical protein QOF62_2419 [Pyrinomonadaceae bacterium]|jgi:hypothetical protein|nr:hypothetical protein [Pyrinomonadaceae bacterium]